MRFYEEHAEEYIITSNKFNMKKFYNFFKKETANYKNPDVLDFGFGSARDMLYFNKLGLNVEGVDTCKYFLEHAQKHDLKVYDSFPNKEYDIIYSISVVNHLDKNQRIELFKKFKKSIFKRKGIIVISFLEDDREKNLLDDRPHYPISIEELIEETSLKLINSFKNKNKAGLTWTTVSLGLSVEEKVSQIERTYQRDGDKKYIASWSGGKDSTFMVDQLLRNGDPLDYIIFSNTGYEFEKMYDYIEKVKNYWESKYPVEVVLLNKGEAGRNIWKTWAEGEYTRGELQGEKRGLPFSIGMSWCTRELKIKPMEQFIKSKIGNEDYYSYVGIAFDEPKRISDKEEFLIYPLYDWRIIEKEVETILIERELHNPLYNHFSRTGCFLCPKQNLTSLYKVWKNYPKEWKILSDMMEKYENIGAANTTIRGMSIIELEDYFYKLQAENKEPENNRDDEIEIGCFCK